MDMQYRAMKFMRFHEFHGPYTEISVKFMNVVISPRMAMNLGQLP